MVATSYTGGQIAPATAAATLNIFSQFFFSKMYFLYTSLSWRKKLGFEISFYPPEKGCNLWGGRTEKYSIAMCYAAMRGIRDYYSDDVEDNNRGNED